MNENDKAVRVTLRFQLDRADDASAWEYLQQLKQIEKTSYSKIIVQMLLKQCGKSISAFPEGKLDDNLFMRKLLNHLGWLLISANPNDTQINHDAPVLSSEEQGDSQMDDIALDFVDEF